MKYLLAASIILFTFQSHAQNENQQATEEGGSLVQHETQLGGALKATEEGGSLVLNYSGDYTNVGNIWNTELDINAAYELNWQVEDVEKTKIDRIDVSLEQIYKVPFFMGLDMRTEFGRDVSPTLRARVGVSNEYKIKHFENFTTRTGVAVEWLAKDDYQRGIGVDVALEFKTRKIREIVEIESRAQIFISNKKSLRNYNSIIIPFKGFAGFAISIGFNVFLNQYMALNPEGSKCNCDALITERQMVLLVNASFKFGTPKE